MLETMLEAPLLHPLFLCTRCQACCGAHAFLGSSPHVLSLSLQPACALDEVRWGAPQALLEGSLARPRMPTLHDVVAAASAGDPARAQKPDGPEPPGGMGALSGDARAAEQPGPGADRNPAEGAQPAPAVRWYDARARVALKRVAAWLLVPPGKLATLERIAAQQAQVRAGGPPQ